MEPLVGVNSKSAPALTALGASWSMYMRGERGARLTLLSSQLVGPRGPRARAKTPAGRPVLSGGIARDALTNEMDAVLAEGAALGPEAAVANLADLIALAFEVGDVREGRGERTLFTWAFLHLARRLPKTMTALLRQVPHYASWAHLAIVYEEATLMAAAPAAAGDAALQRAMAMVRGGIVALWARQLIADDLKLAEHEELHGAGGLAAQAGGDAAAGGAGAGAGAGDMAVDAKDKDAAKKPRAKLSLAGKWAPRIGGAYDSRVGLGRAIAGEMARLRAAGYKPGLAEAAAAAAAAAAEVAGEEEEAEEDEDMDMDEDGDGDGDGDGAGAKKKGKGKGKGKKSGGGGIGAAVHFDLSEVEALVGLGALAVAAPAPAPAAGAAAAAAPLAPAAVKFDAQSPAQRACERAYRVTLSRLNASLGTVETLMCASASEGAAGAAGPGGKRRWAEIDPFAVPSKANLRYRSAFMNTILPKPKQHKRRATDKGVRGGVDPAGVGGGKRSADPDRVACADHFKAAVLETLKGGADGGGRKLKAGRNQPHEIVKAVMETPVTHAVDEAGNHHFERVPDDMLEALWASMIAELKEKGSFAGGGVVPLCDVSGSMQGLPMEASIAFGLLISALQPAGSPWAGKFMTFESRPRWHDVSGCATLTAAVESATNARWGGTTDFGAALRLLLDTATGAKLPASAMPSTLIVFTDMEWDAAYEVEGGRAGLKDWRDVHGMRDGAQVAPTPEEVEEAAAGYFVCGGVNMRRAFRDAGYAPPQIVLWNLRATGAPTFQAETCTPGVSMVSGFSQAILTEFMASGDLAAAGKAGEAEAKAKAAAAAAAAAGGAAAGGAGSGSASASSEPEGPSPWDTLRRKLGSLRYDRLRRAIEASGEGELAGYKWSPPPADRDIELGKLAAAKAKKAEAKANARAKKAAAEAGDDEEGDAAGPAAGGAGAGK